MPSYKLISAFDIRGLGEVIRQLLELAYQPFEDVRYTFEEFLNHKKDSPFGQMPVLEVDGQQLPQSFAIARFLARKYGFAGKDDFEAAWVDAIGDQYKDYLFELQHHFSVMAGVRPGDKEETRNAAEAARLKIFPFLEKRLADTKRGFIVGDGLTWIDVFVSEHVDVIKGLMPGFLDEYPKVLAHSTKVRSQSKLKVNLDQELLSKKTIVSSLCTLLYISFE